jgi:hypothetical protein
VTDERFAHDRFFVRQLIKPIVNVYEVSADGRPVALVRQKRMVMREDLRAFADQSETEEVFRIKARSVMDIAGRYDVTDGNGTPLGALVKVFGASLLRSTWRVLDTADAPLFIATERSRFVSIFRRLVDIVPFGELLPIPYHFVFLTEDGSELGGLDRVIGVRDQYTLHLEGDPERRVDRRLAVALAIALDALQAR